MTKNKTRATRSALGGALLAGGMLLAIPAAIASADDPDSGVNGRPALEHAAPGVDAVQKAGDNFFDNHSFADGTDVGNLYHAVYGRSTVSAQGLHPNATEGSNGLNGGVLNTFPRVFACNIAIQRGC
jgi:hypothetical protein